MSPFQKWLKELDMSQGRFAAAAGVSRSLVQAVASGETSFGGSLRQYVEAHRPDVALAQDAWIEMHSKSMNQRVSEAVT